jgi:LAS superfamily LD-carboxypeptidase LdcB
MRRRLWVSFVVALPGLQLLLVPTAPANAGIEAPNAITLAAASQNAASMHNLSWAPFGRAETGWDVYGPLIAREIGATDKPDSAAFAVRLASWQGAHALPASGVFDAATFLRMKTIWQSKRPFVAASHGACPAPPAQSALAEATAEESYGGKQIFLEHTALDAYRRLVSAARAAVPQLAIDERLLTIFSGYRSPEYDAARCARENNCQGVVRAACSAHRTGLAMDLYLGAAPGFAPDSSADENRLFMTRSRAYLWLVANAARFGFSNYAFEPWHWEWAGKTN